MRVLLGFLLWLFCASTIVAQQIGPISTFSKSFEIVTEKKGKEKFKGQVIKGKRNGMGLYSFKDGSVYIGDFYMNQISGYGMLLASKQILNCDRCQVYVGNFKDGKKCGSGVCYDENGDIIYQGQFADDKPTGPYPSAEVNIDRYFSLIELGNGNTYIGELKGNDVNGFGAIIFSNGDIWQSQFKNGNQKGIGLYMSYDGEWETINYKGDNSEIISSSEKYKEQAATAKANFNKAISSAFAEFKKAGETALALVNEIKSSKDGNDGDYSENESGSSGSSAKSKNGSSGKSSHSGNEVEAKNRDQRSYSGYESQLIKMNTYWEDEYNDSHRRDIQSKMKQIRTKWEGRGFQMFKSSWEDWDGRKR